MKDLTNLARAAPAQRSSRWPIFLCLGLSLTYPFYSVPAHRATGHLAQELGATGARVLTESAIWLDFVIVSAYGQSAQYARSARPYGGVRQIVESGDGNIARLWSDRYSEHFLDCRH